MFSAFQRYKRSRSMTFKINRFNSKDVCHRYVNFDNFRFLGRFEGFMHW